VQCAALHVRAHEPSIGDIFMVEEQIRRAFRIAAREPAEASPRRTTVDLSRTTPTLLPEALRDASQRALGHANDPLNLLDYNPYVSDEWAVVAAELQSFATQLERSFTALFDGKYPLPRLARRPPDTCFRGEEAAPRASTLLFDLSAA
jgi:hypothetical protein